jgi:hypothetical protein
LAATRTLRSTCPSPAWDTSSAPGVLGEFGDDPDRYVSGKARKNYVAARFIRNDRLTGALMAQARSALGASPGARALYDAERARGI